MKMTHRSSRPAPRPAPRSAAKPSTEVRNSHARAKDRTDAEVPETAAAALARIAQSKLSR